MTIIDFKRQHKRVKFSEIDVGDWFFLSYDKLCVRVDKICVANLSLTVNVIVFEREKIPYFIYLHSDIQVDLIHEVDIIIKGGGNA